MDGLTEKKINELIDFQPSYFLKCVFRRGPPSFVLYFRVRAVFDVFGGKLDSKSSKPLFNTLAFMKAREVVFHNFAYVIHVQGKRGKKNDKSVSMKIGTTSE